MPPRSRGPSGPLLKHLLTPPISHAPLRHHFSPFICHNCQRLTAPTTIRTFTHISPLQKKSSASSKSATPTVSPPNVTSHVPNNAATRACDSEIDPYDYTTLQSAIDKALARLKDALTKSRDAGRVSAPMIEDLPVELNVKGTHAAGGSAHKQKTRIGDVASVVPKGGRSMHVFCAEEAHVKPLMNALQASAYSLTPQADGNNPLLIVVPVPPVTAETRAQAGAEAKRCVERASLEVRTARGEAQKEFRRMELGKLVVVDELRKARRGMEEVVKKAQEEVRRVGEAAVKALER